MKNIAVFVHLQKKDGILHCYVATEKIKGKSVLHSELRAWIHRLGGEPDHTWKVLVRDLNFLT